MSIIKLRSLKVISGIHRLNLERPNLERLNLERLDLEQPNLKIKLKRGTVYNNTYKI
jgi:hypothetical protein